MNCSWCNAVINPTKMNMHVDFHHPDRELPSMNLCRDCAQFAISGMADGKRLAIELTRISKIIDEALEESTKIHEEDPTCPPPSFLV